MKIELTEQEAQELVTLLDTATKGGGLQAALLAVPLFQKLHAAADSEGAQEPVE